MARPRIPDEMKEARGTLQPCRKQGEGVTEVLLTECKPPQYLRGEAKKMFASTASTLICWGLMTEADVPIIALYAQALAEIRECDREIAASGKFNTVYDDSGKVCAFVQNPYIKLRQQNVETVLKIAKEYGLTAMSRRQLASSMTSKKEKDEFAEFDEI